jgi:hypothetical protein
VYYEQSYSFRSCARGRRSQGASFEGWEGLYESMGKLEGVFWARYTGEVDMVFSTIFVS